MKDLESHIKKLRSYSRSSGKVAGILNGQGWGRVGVRHGHMVGFHFKRNPSVCVRIALWVWVWVVGLE